MECHHYWSSRNSLVRSKLVGMRSRQERLGVSNVKKECSIGHFDCACGGWFFLQGHGCCYYEGGFYNAIMTFPPNYPNSPPTVRFTSEMWHPNVYPDGRVCISILHAPGDDPSGYELASERWSPVHTVETILLSIISMLSSPNDESPANIDAAKEWRENREEFKKKVSRVVRCSQEL